MATDEHHNDERQSDLAVLDANEYKQKRRLERILDTLDGVQDTSNEAWNRYTAGEIDQDAFNVTVQRAVKNAVRECYKLLYDHHRNQEGSERYWAGKPSNPIGTIQRADGDEMKIVGLRDFLKTETVITEEISMTVGQRNGPPQTRHESVEYTLPRRISYQAYLRLKEFLDDVHDMEISFEEMDDSLPNWGFESEEDIPDDAVVL